MEYTSYSFDITPFDESFCDVLASELGKVGFDSFETDSGILKGYILNTKINANAIDSVIKDFPIPGIDIKYTIKPIVSANWNSLWEQNFQPIQIGNLVHIHDERSPQKEDVAYDILIHPRMAFGSGSHSTTRQMLQLLYSSGFQGIPPFAIQDIRTEISCAFSGKRVLDVGCGTGILGIAALLGGCKQLTAIDIDIDSVRNTKENILLNGLPCQEVIEGDLSLVSPKEKFDIILSNIHLNIHLSQMELYSKRLCNGGSLFLSGFFTDDAIKIASCAHIHGLTKEKELVNDGWCAVQYTKTVIN